MQRLEMMLCYAGGRWGLLTLTMFNICLPVDVLIFFKEPLGPFGTLFATIWAIIPFLVMVGDATFPEKEVIIEDKSKDTLTNH